MTDTTHAASSAATDSTSPRVERAVENLLTISKLWATHGIEIGLSALKTSAESLRLASETLSDLKDRLTTTPDSDTKSAN